MTKLQEKAQAQVKQMVGQMIGDEKLVLEGQEQQEKTERDPNVAEQQGQQERRKDKAPSAKKKPADPATRKGPVLE